jgi:hypothetical protein
MKLRHRGSPFCIGLFLLYLISLCSVAGEDEKIAWIEGRFFDIIGTDNRSVSFANVLGEHVAETCHRYLKAGSHDFPRQILVTLRPQERVGSEESYRIHVSPRGQVGLDFFWDESLSFETTCRAFAEAYLMYYARFNYGVGADERIRFWAVSTIALRSYLSLRPAQKTNYIREIRRAEMLEIETLLSLYLPEVAEEKLDMNQGYWVFQILRDNGLTNSQLVALLDRAIAGVNVEAQIAEALFSESKRDGQSGARLEAWWQSQVTNYLAQEHEFCDSLEISQSWIREMAEFDAYHASSGKLKNLMELWTCRYDEDLRSVLSARCEIIRLRMEQVNPAYFNAALSLGALYETVLEAEHKHQFIRAITVYLNDWEDTKRLHGRVDEIISMCD